MRLGLSGNRPGAPIPPRLPPLGPSAASVVLQLWTSIWLCIPLPLSVPGQQPSQCSHWDPQHGQKGQKNADNLHPGRVELLFPQGELLLEGGEHTQMGALGRGHVPPA